MAQILTPTRILEIAKASQYITGTNVATETFFKGGSLNRRLDILIYMERKGIQYQFDKNPALSSLRETSNYLFSILGYKNQAQTAINNQTQSPPSITNPASQSVDVGDNAVFSTTATSDLPVTYQWLLNGSPILGATNSSYTVTNAQLSDSGNQYSVTVTNAVGSVTSSPATLTVTQTITGYFTYSPTTDFYPILQTNSDPFIYGTSYTITHNAPISITLPGAMPANQYMLVKVPIGESVKTIWNNGNFNNGNLPDSVWNSIIQFGGYTYYSTRVQATMDVNQPLILS